MTKVVLPAIRKDGGYIHGEEHVVSGARFGLPPAFATSESIQEAPTQVALRLPLNCKGHGHRPKVGTICTTVIVATMQLNN